MNRRFALAVGAALLAVPVVALAQTVERPLRLGWFLGPGGLNRIGPFRIWADVLRSHGYVEGRNADFRIIPQYHGDIGKLKASMRELVEWKPNAIVTQATFNTRIAQAATSSIPIVFTDVADPVASGIVKSLARPGGNITGVTVHNLTLFPKRLGLVRELLPQAGRVSLIIDRTFTRDGFPPAFYREMHETAARLGLELIEEDLSQCPGGFAEAFENIVALKPDIVMPLGPWPSLRTYDTDYAKFQDRHGIPVFGFQPVAGGAHDGVVIQYGGDVEEAVFTAGDILARIIAGARPADIPIHQQTRVVLVVNLVAARQLGIAVPNSILVRADRVIQ